MNQQQRHYEPAPRTITTAQFVKLLDDRREAANSELTIAQLWERRAKQERKRVRNRFLVGLSCYLLFLALAVYFAWPRP
jgi:type IV secretory pathway TrbF-like protein